MSALLPVYPRLDLQIVAADGCHLTTATGRRLLDLYGGHAVSPLGHAHPQLCHALRDGFSTLDFYSNSVRLPWQEEAARCLLDDSAHLGYAHFVNSGTEANEAALHLARRLTGRVRVLSFDCGFHGRTLGALAATGLAGYRDRLTVVRSQQTNGFVRFGDETDLSQVDDSVAAVLCEAIPSLAGVYLPPEGYYRALERRCREVGALLIFDEVQAGVGRIGTWFAHRYFEVEPDLVTLAKGIAGGFPAGALLVARPLGQHVQHGELGSTFGGGPLACRMIAEVARVIHQESLTARARQVHQWVRDGLAGLSGVEVRGAGCLIGIQTPLSASALRVRLLDADIVVGTSAEPNTVRLLPPYTVAEADLRRFCTVVVEALQTGLE